MTIQATVRTRAASRKRRLNKELESKTLVKYLSIVRQTILKGFKFKFPNGFGEMAIVQRDRTNRGKGRNDFYKPIIEVQYKGPLNCRGIKFVTSKLIRNAIKSNPKNYRSEIITDEYKKESLDT